MTGLLLLALAAHAGEGRVELGAFAEAGPSRLADVTGDGTWNTYDVGWTALVGFDWRRWTGDGWFYGLHVGYGVSRANLDGFLDIRWLPWGVADMQIGVGSPEGRGPYASAGLGFDLVFYLPMPIAGSLHIGWRVPAESSVVSIGVFGRGLITPFASAGHFPAATRWNAGVEWGVAWGRSRG